MVVSEATISGFHIHPQGKLLRQVLHLESPLGLAYERAIGFEKKRHTHHRHMLVCPRGACRMEVVDEVSKKNWTIDSTQLLWVPMKIPHSDEGKSAIYDTLALFPCESYFDEMIKDNGLSYLDKELLESRIVLLKRTRWLNDILDRYFFERILSRPSPDGSTYFLEKQIINEVARILFHEKLQKVSGDKEDEGLGKEPFDRALRYIESNLFSALTLELIVSAAGVSKSSLMRKFRETLKQTPFEYIKTRRLDEALSLMKQGDHSIGDISLLVGYEDFSAFSRAFRQRFKNSPSKYMGSNK